VTAGLKVIFDEVFLPWLHAQEAWSDAGSAGGAPPGGAPPGGAPHDSGPEASVRPSGEEHMQGAAP
jgi:hypothetical protein